jgi:hypothetical protein
MSHLRFTADRFFSILTGMAALFAFTRPGGADRDGQVVRGSRIELADKNGVVRFQVEVTEAGALMQMRGAGGDSPWSVLCGVTDVVSPSISFGDFKYAGNAARASLGVEGMPGEAKLTLTDGAGHVRFRAQGPPKDSERATLEVRNVNGEAVIYLK